MNIMKKVLVIVITILTLIFGIILTFIEHDSKWYFIGMSLSLSYITGELLLNHLEWHKKMEKIKK